MANCGSMPLSTAVSVFCLQKEWFYLPLAVQPRLWESETHPITLCSLISSKYDAKGGNELRETLAYISN